MSEIYSDRIANDRLRLSDLAWLCSDALRARIPTVQALRVAAESASERAKAMAEMKVRAEDIEPYAQQAKEAVEGYMAIYAAVDEELAVQYKRLSIDQPYIERFKTRFKGVDLEKVLRICRPYYEKVRRDDPAIDARVRLAIETDSPEYAAKMKREQQEKEEVQAISRYLRRTDKGPSAERIKTMTERIARLRELRGDQFADDYLPLLNKTIDDYNAAHPDAPYQPPKPSARKSSARKSDSRKSAKK